MVELENPFWLFFADGGMEIRILIDKSPGTMARVVTSLRRLGMVLDGQRLTEAEQPECSELVVDAQGPVTADEISQKLMEIKGVVKLLNVGAPGEAPAS